MATKPLILAALGARGTGKSAWVRQHLESTRPARLAAWDLMQEMDYLGPPAADLAAALRGMKARRFAVRFCPARDDKTRAAQFDIWCRGCLAAGNLTAYVEELAFVTTAHKAPPGWREMCLLGRHESHRVSIIGTSQRPAQVDKEFMGNLDLIHVGRLASEGDARKAAGLLGVPWAEVLSLPDLAWLEKGLGDVAVRRGVLRFKPARPAPKATRKTTPPPGEDIPADQVEPGDQAEP